jgi:outer membrane protein TolC
MKITPVLWLLVLFLPPGFTQTDKSLALEECYKKAMESYPLTAKTGLLQQASGLKLEQLDAARRPVIDWQGQASYQSETVQFPFELPGVKPIELPLFRAQTSINAGYTIYDGGMAEAQKALERAGLLAEQQSVAVDLERLKDRINDYFFGVLMLREKVKILETSLNNLQTKIATLAAGVSHGAVLESEVDKLRVEALRLQSQLEETRAQARGLLSVLSELIDEPLDEEVVLEMPDLAVLDYSMPLQRSELRLFDLQKEKILAGEGVIAARWKPKAGAFLQAGVGYPNPLNFFDDNISPFAIGGVQFTWTLFDWKQASRDRQLLTVQSRIVDNQRAVFEKNIQVLDGKFLEDIKAVENLIERDRQIEALQEKILQQASSQLDNGVITSTEYLDQVNAEIQARLSLEIHMLQLRQIKVNYLTLKGLL